MSVTATALRKLAMLNLSAEQMAGVLDILADGAEADEMRRSGQRDRTRKHRAKRDGNVTVTLPECYTVSPKKEIPPTPPKEKTTPSTVSEAEEASSTKARATKAEFEIWYQRYPHKVQRGAAERAFVKARSLASLEDLITGVDRYIASKPADRQWQNPATWLNGKGWMDVPAVVAPQNRATAPPGRTMSDVLDDIKSGNVIVPDLLEHLTGKRHEQPHAGPTIEAGFERADRGGVGHPNQVYAFPSRGRP